MIDDAAKANMYIYLKHEREAVLAKLDGLSEYDVRRPLTVTNPARRGLHAGSCGHGPRTQNSLPSGSANTTQGRSPWPMSTRRAP